MANYSATPEQWAAIEELSHSALYGPACILELRARVEALEGNSSARLTSSNYLEKPDSSLVERVAQAMDETPGAWDDFNGMARAAIREVAAWLREREGDYSVIRWLEQEAER